ncbi:PH domain-containing protein [Sphingomicrobium sp. XHP0239]|uniref:PH domain-containing protein n=1 Tax=Sphingomicrobium maritimum TaxID=3133972 RepID=UPI0031CC800F
MSEAGVQTIDDPPATLADEPADARERLHPLTLFTGLGAAVRGAWAALLGSVYFVSQGNWYWALFLVGGVFVVSLLGIGARYLSFSYRVEADEIDMASGIVSRNERSIPFDRIQDVNIEQGLLHRLVGLARVKFETGASAGANAGDDGSLDSITLARANELRDRIRAHRAGEGRRVTVGDAAETAIAKEEERPVIFAMSPRRILTLCLFSFSLAIVGALFGLAQTYGDALGLDLFDPDFWAGIVARSGPLQELVLANRALTILFGIASLMLAGFLTAFVRVIPREWNFTLRRTETGFRRQRGLFTLTDVVIPLKRVQAAILDTGPVRRRSGYFEFKVQSLGSDTGNAGDHTLAPLGTRSEIEGIVEEMEWRALSTDTRGWDRPRPAFVTSSLLVSLPIVILIAFGTAAAVAGIMWSGDWDLENAVAQFLPIFGSVFLAIYLLSALSRWLDYRHRRHTLDGDRFVMRSGWWRQRLVVLPLGRIQSIDVKRNFIDRVFGIADVRIGVAGGGGFSAHGIDAVTPDEAMALREALLEPVR